MKDFGVVVVFLWLCAFGASAVFIALGVPWYQALAHAFSACFVGTACSTLLMHAVEQWVQRVAASQEVR